MTNVPDPNNPPETPSPRQSQRRRWWVLVGIILLITLAGGITAAWIFVQRMLAPMVEKNVSRILNRPVQMGNVERFSLTSLRFGVSKLPPTPTDSDRAVAQAVEVAYNPLQVIFNRELGLDITLVKPNAYIDQDADGEWIETKLKELPKGRIDIKLQVLRVRDADVVLVPRSEEGKVLPQVAIAIPSGQSEFLDENQRIRFNLGGKFLSGGNFTLKGERLAPKPNDGDTPTSTTKLQVTGQNIGALELDRLIPLPLDLLAGRVGGNLDIEIQPDEPIQFLGVASLNNVTARIPALPQPFNQTNGSLRFKGTQIRLERVTSKFGQIPAEANGVLDTQSNFNLSARTQPVELKQVLQTFNIKKSPVTLVGTVQTALQITGPIAKPIVTGDAITTKPTQIDRVTFRTISGGFKLDTGRGTPGSPVLVVNNLQANPTVGGAITGNGEIQLGKEGGLRFNVQANQIPVEAIARDYNITLPAAVGLASGKAQIFGPLDNPQGLRATGSANVNVAGGTVSATNIQFFNPLISSQVQVQRVQLERLGNVPPQLRGPVSGEFNLALNLNNASLSGVGGTGSARIDLAGGTIFANNLKLAESRWQTNLEASGIQLGRLFPQIPPQLQAPLNGTFALSGSLKDLSVSKINGTGNARVNVAGGIVTASNIQLIAGRWQSLIQATGVQLGQLVPQLPPQFQSPFTGTFNASGSLEALSPKAINVSGSGQLKVGEGTVQASQVQLAQGKWQANVEAENVPLAGLVPQLPPQLAGLLAGNFNLSGSLDQLGLAGINGSGSGRLRIGDGIINAADVQLIAGRWQANVQAAGVQLANLVPQLPPQFAGLFEGVFDLSGNLNQLALNGINAQGRGSLAIAGGTVTASNIQLSNGTFQALVEPQGVELARLSSQLEGLLDGRVNVSGSLASLNPQAITQSLRAEGELNFSEGIALIDRPLTTAFRWTGEGIQIQQATAEGLSASGFVGVNLITERITNFNLNVAADDLNLQELSAYLPPSAANLTVAGLADFNGVIAGTIATPNIQGNLQLENFAIDGLAFEPILSGDVNTTAQGLELNVKGNNDRIEIALGSDYRPVSFNIQQGEAIALGSRNGDLLQVNTQNFPISIIKELTPVPAAIATQPLSGKLSGNLAVNLNTFEVAVNQLEITGPIFAIARGDESPPGNNQYILSGRIIRTQTGPEFQGQVDIKEGQLQVLVTALELVDFNKLSLIDPRLRFDTRPNIVAVGLPESPLQTQLRRFSEITTLLERQEEQQDQASPLPDLEELDGTFTGTVQVNGSLATGINAEFDLQGEDWTWDNFEADRVIAKGNFQNGVLTLLPVQLESDDALATFSGTIGGETQSGQLRLENVPVALIQEVVNLPPAIGFGGRLNATATLAGSLSNPQARGEVTVLDATVNQEKVQSAQGSFSYNNARLNFSAESILSSDSDPLLIAGSIPYKLPFPDAIAPESNALNLDINVKDEGLALLNVLSRQQIAWVDGTGEVKVTIKGIFDQEKGRPTALIAQGSAIFNNATIAAVALPEPLTEASGNIEFNFDRIDVQELSGNFGGGRVTALGTIPISQPIRQENPLIVNIPELALNLKGRYSGSVKGNVVLTGAALSPVVSGQIELFEGRVPLPDQAAETASVGTIGGESNAGIPIEFDNLEITLGKDIEIRKAPILNFLARGMLTLDGSLDNLEPTGTIDLLRGQVNLFTTQFRLARGYENTATFRPNEGLDPYLDVRLVASVAEATQRRLPTGPQSAEIIDAPEIGFGTVQTVRVQARVEGQASQLADQIELTSTPARSEAEIVALLGGGFVDTLGRGDSTLGLANLAGSALLGNVSNTIGDALGLTEFRLFPTIITNDEERTSTLGLAAEAGIDISRNFSVSVLKELTTNQPFQYNLRYRVNENILLRGGTDFSGDSRAVIEYERRF